MTKPTPQEVTEYALSIGFKLDGEAFCDHYEARGWRYNGNVAMVNWKAAVRTWKRNNPKNVIRSTAEIAAQKAKELERYRNL